MVKISRSKAEVLVDRLARRGVRRAYGVTGGASMFLNIALGDSPSIKTTICLHEQAAAFAACADSMCSGQPVLLFATNGPGSLNLMTGVAAAFLDSVPVIVVTGEAQTKHLDLEERMRNKGIQAVPISPAAASIAKAFHRLQAWDDPCAVVDDLVALALTPRKGPVWLQVPLDVQSMEVTPDDRRTPVENLVSSKRTARAKTLVKRPESIEALTKASRLLLWLGEGARDAIESGVVAEWCSIWDPVVVCSWRLKDRELGYGFESLGSPGIVAYEVPNCLLEAADTVVAVGTRLDFTQLGFEKSMVAKDAFKIGVDVDSLELEKHSDWLDLQVSADANDWFRATLGSSLPNSGWGSYVRQLEGLGLGRQSADRNFESGKSLGQQAHVSVSAFGRLVSSWLNDEVLVVGSSGSAIEIFLHSLARTRMRRLVFSTGLGSMGCAVPSAVGSCFGSAAPVLCVESDGSLMFNIQEIATLVYHKLPVLLCILDNGGYASIRNSQNAWFEGSSFGSDPATGLPSVDIASVLRGFGMEVASAETLVDVRQILDEWREHPKLLALHLGVDGREDRLPRIPSRLADDGQMVQAGFTDFVGGAPEADVLSLRKVLGEFGVSE